MVVEKNLDFFGQEYDNHQDYEVVEISPGGHCHPEFIRFKRYPTEGTYAVQARLMTLEMEKKEKLDSGKETPQ